MVPDREPGTRWTVPVPAFLVVHRAGRLLFDTGVHCAAITDPVGRLGESRARRFGVRSQPGDDVVSQLALLGLRPDDVTLRRQLPFPLRPLRRQRVLPAVDVPRPAAGAGGRARSRGPGREALRSERARLRSSARLPAGRRRARRLRRRDGRAHPDPRPHPRPPVPPGARGQGNGPGAGRRRLLHAGEHGPGPPPGSALGPGEMARSLARLRELRDRQGATVIFGHDPAQWQEPAPRAGAARGWLTWLTQRSTGR